LRPASAKNFSKAMTPAEAPGTREHTRDDQFNPKDREAMRNVLRPLFKLAHDRHVAIMFALSAAPMIAMVVLGLDSYRKLSYGSQLDAAAATIEAKKTIVSANAQSESSPPPTGNIVPEAKAQDKPLCSHDAPDRPAKIRFRPTPARAALTPATVRRSAATHILKICGACKYTYSEVELEPVRRHGALSFWSPTPPTIRPLIHQRSPADDLVFRRHANQQARLMQ
jgi:hypothetical protein